MNKPKSSIKVFFFSLIIATPRMILVVAQFALIAFPSIVILWGLARKWSRLDKKGLLIAIQTDFRSNDSYIPIAITIMIVGIAFYIFKKYQQLWYGFIETMVALIGCFVIAQAIRRGVYQAPSANSILLQGFGAVYLLVRGLSNIDDGLKKNYWFKEDKEAFVKGYKGWRKAERFYRRIYKEGRLFDENGKLTRPPDKWDD